MSAKYELIKETARIIPFQKIMAEPYEKLLKAFHTAVFSIGPGT